MSYGIHPYLVDTGALTAMIGANDPKLVGDVLAQAREDIAHLNAWFDDDIHDGEFVPFETAIEHLISGRFCADEVDAAQYGYALEILCRSIGESIGPADFTQLSLHWLHDLPILGTLAYDPGPLANLMPMPDEFPGIGFIAEDQIEARLAKAIDAMHANRNEDAAPLYREYVSWLQRAKTSNKALALFLY